METSGSSFEHLESSSCTVVAFTFAEKGRTEVEPSLFFCFIFVFAAVDIIVGSAKKL